jgi:tetratricopeptide (TPR) repeat protein
MKTLGISLLVLMLVGGAGLVGYARWTHAVAEADGALADGRLDDALAAYERAEARFERTPAAAQLFRREHARAAANRLWVLYRLERYDDAIEAAEQAPLDSAPFFWSGCAFFEKARAETQPETRLGWLVRAEEQFRKAVEAAPGDWDTKFNYELTTRLTAELRKNPKTPPSQMMQLLRPSAAGTKAPRRVG